MFLDRIYSGLLITCYLCSIVQNADVEKPTTDPIFGDIMRNISRVNTLLRDLIKNYEQLKKMSQPESIESNYSEEDEVFRSKSKYTTTARTHKVFATAMIVSDTEESNVDNSRESKINKDLDEAKNEKRFKKEKRDKRKQPVNKVNRSKKKRKGRHEKQALETNDKSKQKDLIPTLEALRKLIKAFSEETDYDEELKNKSNASSTPTGTTLVATETRVPKIIMLGPQTKVHAPKIKKHLKHTVEHYDFPKIEITSRQGSNIARVLEQGDGQQQNVALYLERNNHKKQPNNPQKTLIIVPTNKKKSEPGIQLSELDSDSADDLVQREELNAVMLRQAYGDACLRLVLRKCTMACKAVYKEVCQGSKKCSSKYKHVFKKAAISGCSKQFGNSSSLSFRGVEDEPSVGDDGFVDLTREGYLGMACSPSAFSNKASMIKPIIRSNHSDTSDIKSTLNILRDKYEAACQTTSISKCIKACRYASKEACDAEKCVGRKKMALEKSCKNRCKQNYGRGYSGEDSSDDDTSSDSEKSDKSKSREDKNEW